MLSILKSRLDNSADEEFAIAANEQAGGQIAKIRLEELLMGDNPIAIRYCANFRSEVIHTY